MSRHLLGLSVWLAVLWPAAAQSTAAAAPAAAPAPLLVTFAEQPLRLVRGASLYRAGRGVALQEGDMFESGAGAIQVDAGGVTVAIGPASRAWVRSAGEIVLLEGWLKLRGHAGRPLTVSTANLQLASAGATVTLHAQGDTTELFAESGEVPVRALDAGKPRRAGKLASEQFATRSAGQALRIAARPPAAFLAALPRDLRDALVPLGPRGLNGPAVAPRLERAATYAELAPWVAGHDALRQRLQRRFHPPRRLSSPRPAMRPAT